EPEPRRSSGEAAFVERMLAVVTRRRARALLKPSLVRRGSIPTWLRERLRAAWTAGRLGSWPRGEPDDDALLGLAVGVASGSGTGDEKGWRGSWFDHWGSTDWLGVEALVSEPYEVDELACRRFAELLGLEWRLSANSRHLPGATFRIL